MEWVFGEFSFDPGKFELHRDGELQPLQPQVLSVLAHLLEHRDRLVSKEELLDQVWGDRFVSESALSSRIKSLRSVLGDDGRSQRLIRTVHGKGYRFVADVAVVGGDETIPGLGGASGAVGVARPSGTVTLLFTDVEASTRLWEEHEVAMAAAIARHDDILRNAIESHGGYIFSRAGDSFAAAFQQAADAVSAAVSAQQQLALESWPEDVAPLRVRMGTHSGVAEERAGDYFGATVNRAARVMSAGHGGQVLLSGATAGLVADDVDRPVRGRRRLRCPSRGGAISPRRRRAIPACTGDSKRPRSVRASHEAVSPTRRSRRATSRR